MPPIAFLSLAIELECVLKTEIKESSCNASIAHVTAAFKIKRVKPVQNVFPEHREQFAAVVVKTFSLGN